MAFVRAQSAKKTYCDSLWHLFSYSSMYLIFLTVLQWLTQSEQSSVSTGEARAAAERLYNNCIDYTMNQEVGRFI